MTSPIWVTDRIKKDLETLAKKEGVTLEGLTCILLRLSLSDRGFVEMVLNLIKSGDLNCGATELEKRGW
ncbi:MAG: hypothetical protein DSO00_05060 [Archaeoglobi archaeon]|jgi:hypothetical protein|nr:MAG: hypothetical protein DSO00_05060 [Archaeoglobi archaeon]